MGLSRSINKRALFAYFCIVLLYLSLLNDIPFGAYIDDVIPLLFGIIWIVNDISNKKKTVEKTIFWLLCLVCLIGVFSNLVAGIVIDIKLIALDLFSYLKIFLVYIGTKSLFANRKKAQLDLVNLLSISAKAFISIAFVFGCLNVLGIVNMSQQIRFGIRTFCFIYSNASQLGILVAVALGFIIFNNERRVKIYEFMGLCTLLMTMKGMSLIIFSVYVGMNFFRTRKVKIWHIAIMCIVLFFILRYQIYTYLFDNTAPRAILLQYGFVTANQYLPLGSGFGTYGSDIAGKYYSPLYSHYGFSARASLIYGKNTALNDAYLAMLLGQFGYIGTIVTYFIFALIGKQIFVTNRKNYKAFYISVAVFTCIIGLSMMAGSLKGTIGELMMFLIQFYCLMNKNIGEKTNG